MHVAVDFLHALRSEVSFGYHLHLHLRRLDVIALAYHRSEGAVSREVAVARDELVAQIYAVDDASLLHGTHACEEALHLLHGVGHKHRLEVIAVLESAAYTRSDGIDVFKHRGILYSENVGRHFRLDKVRRYDVGKGLGLVAVLASYGEIRQPLHCHLFGMRWSADAGNVAVRHGEHFVEVLRAAQVVVGHDALDGCYDELVAYAGLQALEMCLQIWRRSHEYQCVVELSYLVDVAREEYLRGVETHAREVGGVVAEPLKVGNAVVATHIPSDVVGVADNDLGYCRCP